MQTAVNSLNATVIDWASRSDAIYVPSYRCNGDSMHHVNKGIVVIRVEDTDGVIIRKNAIRNVTSFSLAPFDDCFDYHKGANVENSEDKSSLQQGMNVRGISVGAVSDFEKKGTPSLISNNRMYNFFSEHAKYIVGIDIQGKSDSLSIRNNKIDLMKGTKDDPTDAYIALRVREYSAPISDNNIEIQQNNFFAQEVQTMPTKPLGCRSKVRKSEWDLGNTPGGCPFGFKVSSNIFEGA